MVVANLVGDETSGAVIESSAEAPCIFSVTSQFESKDLCWSVDGEQDGGVSIKHLRVEIVG